MSSSTSIQRKPYLTLLTLEFRSISLRRKAPKNPVAPVRSTRPFVKWWRCRNVLQNARSWMSRLMTSKTVTREINTHRSKRNIDPGIVTEISCTVNNFLLLFTYKSWLMQSMYYCMQYNVSYVRLITCGVFCFFSAIMIKRQMFVFCRKQ